MFIGAYFSFGIDEQNEFVRDGRKKGKTFDFRAYEDYTRKRNMTVEQEDEANERQEVVFFMDSDKRTAKKNYMNVKASRMIKKVRENIIAVEKGIFPLGH